MWSPKGRSTGSVSGQAEGHEEGRSTVREMDGGEPQGPLRRLLRRLKEHVSSILCPLDARKEGSRGREASRPKGGLGGAHLSHPEGPTRRASPGPPAPLG